jgi:hypothetical protein
MRRGLHFFVVLTVFKSSISSGGVECTMLGSLILACFTDGCASITFLLEACSLFWNTV